jgi:hypothetical protein
MLSQHCSPHCDAVAEVLHDTGMETRSGGNKIWWEHTYNNCYTYHIHPSSYNLAYSTSGPQQSSYKDPKKKSGVWGFIHVIHGMPSHESPHTIGSSPCSGRKKEPRTLTPSHALENTRPKQLQQQQQNTSLMVAQPLVC